MIIDVHNHFYPKAYLDAVKKGDCVAKAAKDASGNLLVVYEGDFNVVDRGHADAAFRVEEIKRHGIDLQVLTMTTPGVHVEEKSRGIEMARAVNEGFAEIVKSSGGHFQAMAALPLQSPKDAAAELVHSVKELGLCGGTVFTNVNGKTLDLPEFEPLLAAAVDLDVPLFIHPTTPTPSTSYLDYRLAATVGFTFDTTVCVSRLIFSGAMDRFPRLKLISSHLGGTLPYLSERLDRGYLAYPECKKVQGLPSEYLKRVYYDCVLFDPRTVAYAVDVFGASQFMVGSDYPHQIGSLAKAVSVIEDLPFANEVKEQIFGGNARRLFKF
ncbi:MAG: amidohydrolase family protein [Bacillota bacterium]